MNINNTKDNIPNIPNTSNGKKHKLPRFNSNISFVALWIRFFALGSIVMILLLLAFNWFINGNHIPAIAAASENARSFIDYLNSDLLQISDTYNGMLSLVFVVTSLVSMLSDKSETIYWFTVMDYKLVNPHFFNIVSITAFLAASVLSSTLSFLICPGFVYIALIIVIVLLFALSLKMLSGFFFRSSSLKVLQTEFIIDSILKSIDTDIERYFEHQDLGAVTSQKLRFLTGTFNQKEDMMNHWLRIYTRVTDDELKNKIKADAKFNAFINLVLEMSLYDFEKHAPSYASYSNNEAPSIPNELNTYIVKTLEPLKLEQKEFYEKVISHESSVKWLKSRNESKVRQLIFMYKLLTIHELISKSYSAVDSNVAAIIQTELPILQLEIPSPYKLKDLIYALASKPEFASMQSEIDLISTLPNKYKKYKADYTGNFDRKKDLLISYSMKYIDEVNIGHVLENMDLLNLVGRPANIRQIMSYASIQNPEIFYYLLLLHTKKEIKQYERFYQLVLDNYIKNDICPNVVRFFAGDYQTHIQKHAVEYINICDHFFVTPEVAQHHVLKERCMRENEELYSALVPLNELFLKLATYERFTLLNDLLSTLTPLRKVAAKSSSFFRFHVMFLGYGAFAEDENITFDGKLKVWSYLLPEYVTPIRKIVEEAHDNGTITPVLYKELKRGLLAFSRMKYIACYYYSEMNEVHNTRYNITPLNILENYVNKLSEEELSVIDDIDMHNLKLPLNIPNYNRLVFETIIKTRPIYKRALSLIKSENPNKALLPK